VRDGLSREPHRVLGAWDEDAESTSAGARRAFVLLVAPDISSASLETLARDVRARNLDAETLDVRIYDDEDAAHVPRSLDGGAAARAHLVAEVKKSRALGMDVLRVRGEELRP
jgi:hypothetical protein